MKRIFFPLALLICTGLMAQEGTVGIGTQTPNRKAVLHLVARNNNQGLLVPKLTTTQRTNFGSQLNSSDNGMMVYDSDLDQFFYWITNKWEAVGETLKAGTGIEISGGTVINTGDTNASDDFSGEWADLANMPAGFQDGTDDVEDADNDPTNEIELPASALTNQILIYNGTSWGAGFLPSDGDTDATNEIQDLQLISNILSITGKSGATQINLAPYVGTNTDEQDLQFSGSIISLTGDPDNTQIDLSNYDSDVSDDFSGDWVDLANIPAGFLDGTDDVVDADASITNEIQDLSLTGNNLTITGNAFPTTIDLSPYLDNTDLLTTISGTSGQVLTYDGSDWAAADIPADGDTDDTNELQDLQFSSQVISLSNDPGSTTINLAPYMDNTDLLATISGTNGQVLTYSSGNWVADDIPADGDGDATNEIQDLELAGNILTITGNASPTAIDLSPYSGTNTDEQDLAFSGGIISLSGDPDNTQIDLAPYLDNTDLLSTLSGTSGQVLTYDGADWGAANLPADGDIDDTNEIQDLQFSSQVISLSNDPGSTTINLAPYMDNTDLLASISGTNGQVLTYSGGNWVADDIPTDGDGDATNEIQDLQLAGNILTITGNASPTMIDLSPYSGTNTDEQDLAFSGGIISLSGDPDNTQIDLAPYLDNTDLLSTISGTSGQVLTYDGADWGAADLPTDGDSDDTNELQDLSIASDILTITGLGTPTDIDLSPYINTDLLASISGTNGQVLTHNGTDWGAANLPADGDSDDTNELQDLSIASDILTITGLGTPTDIDLSPYINTDLLASLTGTNGQVLTYDGSNWAAANLPTDGDTNDANELQDLDLTGNTLTITGLVTPTDIDLAPYLDNTDLLASISGTNGQVLTHNGTDWVAGNVPSDGDSDDTNELQDLSIASDILTITGLGTPTDIDLTPYINTDLLASISGTNGQVLTHDGSNWAAANLPADGDMDDANEIQDLSLTGDNLTITLNASPTSIDLSPYKDSPLTESTDAIGSYVSYSGHIKALNVINTVSSITHSSLSGSQLPILAHLHAKTVMLDVSGAAGSTDTITEIEAGLNGQEMIIVCTGGTLVFDNSQMNGSNLVLPSATVSLPTGGSIKLMYVSAMSNWVHLESVTTVVNPN